MSSSPFLPPPTIILDDADDEFDWEAAVREIDSACDAADSAVASTSRQQQPERPKPRPSGGLRQSTLEGFVERCAKTLGSRDSNGGSGGRCVGSEDYGDVGIDRGLAGGSGCGDDGMVAVDIDIEAAKTWVYPSNVSYRAYQFSIAKTALFSNTLVALPTGLGKTLIAAVVMYNYFRWFPKGKIVFAAPSRPLVTQQIKACHDIVGIPQEWTIDMTGQISPQKRKDLWKVKRVFYVTPQVLEKDIQTGVCLMKELVCLVIDEAHRATKNYSYCVAVRELMAIPVQLRILALTATPGSNKLMVQNVINNLCISTIEYRDESNQDVKPYVNYRKIEVIKFAMDKDADEIDGLLLEVMKPFVNMLKSKGLLRNRDFTTMSPCEWVKLKENTTIGIACAETRSIISLMSSLSYMRNLLTSYGIKPAYEMLADKLKESLARISRNEFLCKARDLMIKRLSHSAQSPKLLKMIVILTDHFKSKGPKDTRVIIFSSYRESVRDILNSLAQVGELIKATEFVGQSRGKSLKGQNQKIQQAILEKFRSGEYNVIIATSIAEEGLDIMEVDLVICFDANVSSVRMTQRMGRTGRKRDGRVVILACEGPELKGYERKQTTSNSIKKQMLENKFLLYPSPRMVPHIYKPEVQMVEFSIDEFVPRGKAAKDDSIYKSPLSNKIAVKEKDLVVRYFGHSSESTWKPSLIAFPRFQAVSSRTYRVSHSLKTKEMFVNAIQHLQVLPSPTENTVLSIEVKDSSSQASKGFTLALDGNCRIDANLLAVHQDVLIDSNDKAKIRKSDVAAQEAPFHQFLFGSNFVSVSALGKVSITHIPSLPLRGVPNSKILLAEFRDISLQSEKKAACSYETSDIHNTLQRDLAQDALELGDNSKSKFMDIKSKLVCQPCGHEQQLKEESEGKVGIMLQTPINKVKIFMSEDNSTVMPATDKAINHMDLSPRITQYIENGVVPESPVIELDHCLTESECPVSSSFNYGFENCESLKECPSVLVNNSTDLLNEASTKLSNAQGKSSRFHNQGHVPYDNGHLCTTTSEKVRGPIEKEISVHSCGNSVRISDDWQPNSEDANKLVEQVPRYKRLRKQNDAENFPCMSTEKDAGMAQTTHYHAKRNSSFHDRRCDKETITTKTFFEEEAEVSSDAEASDNEEDDKDEDTFDFNDSFIDDRVDLSEASTQAENSGDMMAFYRRSLLTQASLETPPAYRNSSSLESFSAKTTVAGMCDSEESNKSLQIPQNCMKCTDQSTDLGFINHLCISEKLPNLASTSGTSNIQRDSSTLESRKRKLTYFNTNIVANMTSANFFQSDDASKVPLHVQPEQQDPNSDVFCDNDFYKDLDLDALEAQATELLRCKLLSDRKEPKVQSRSSITIIEKPTLTSITWPSFDLGI